ncbi:DUF1016 family protein [Candidatus Woesearchaeota archaeon]|nr:DUF1016 family protein [Candidatus Woesearchaeota archaeon]
MKNSLISRYGKLLDSIGLLLIEARKKAFVEVNLILVKTYWEIGKLVLEYEQNGKEKADYGSQLLSSLSHDLKLNYGKGFSKSNVYLMRLFYLKYPKFQTLSGKLSWSHYTELLGVSEDLARRFYEKECLNEKWSIRELRRQIDSLLFERLSLSKDKKEVLALSKHGQIITDEKALIKEPYVLEFLNIPETGSYSERELEQKIIDNLQMFLLELGKGFTFVSRQYRITLDNKHYYIDLVFYHRILKCFVLIDLKIGKVVHEDIGQMNMYLNYFKEEEMTKEDHEPVGIILAADRDNFLVKYALGGLSNKLFVSKYQLYLPTKEELEQEIQRLI